MADIIERFREKDAEDQQQDAEKRGKADEETAKAVEMRKSSMETFAQSKKRKGEQEQKKSKRSTGTETVAYLREKAELDASLKREELQLRRAELDEKKVQQEGLMAQQETCLTKMLCESIKSQQKKKGAAASANATAEYSFANFTAGCSLKTKGHLRKLHLTCGIYDC